MKFKPFDVFCDKEIKKNKEAGDDQDGLVSKWKELSEKKVRKFVKKAEKIYDQEFEKNNQLPLFCTFLNQTEFQYLIESYGHPAKFPENSMIYYIKNFMIEHTESKHKEAENSWSNLTTQEKQEIQNEFKNAKKDHEVKYAIFLRSLPEERFKDYTEAYILERVFGPKAPQPQNKSSSKKRSKSPDISKQFIPYELFKEKYRTKHPELSKLEVYEQTRNKFRELTDKKRLVFIKDAEANFDAEISKPDLKAGIKKRLSDYLNRAELKLLLESYGMPNNVPSSLHVYYLKQYSTQVKENGSKTNNLMKECMDKLKAMKKSDKDNLIKKHAMELEEFRIKNSKFLEDLSLKRLNDYYHFIGVNKTPSKMNKSKMEIEEDNDKSEYESAGEETDDSDNNKEIKSSEILLESPKKKLKTKS